ncbi:MAG: NADH:flavin oxidoreductase [Desulfobacterales bacterium]
MYDRLFSPLEVGGKTLKNRLVMAPLFLGYADAGGKVGSLLLDHYRLMAKSGVAMVVVEAATIDYPLGCGSDQVIRADTDDNMEGLKALAAAIREEGALACLQLNHVGRFLPPNLVPDQPVAPSPVPAMGREPRALSVSEIKKIVEQFRDAAVRAVAAGFDMVELHGGTGYLLSQFISPRTNLRTDRYGGSPEKRMAFGLEVLDAVRGAVEDIPVGYRFLADEWMPDGLNPDLSIPYAGALAAGGAAYLSVMGGTYESFFLPEVVEQSKNRGYMADLAGEVKKAVNIPVIAAGRIADGQTADHIIETGGADLIGLARVLWADPEWPQKVESGREDEIIHCDPKCGDTCMQMIMMGRPAFCVRWPVEKQKEWKAKA